MRRRLFPLAAMLVFSSVIRAADAPTAQPASPFPIEEESPDPKLAKIVLVGGSTYYKPGEHEYLATCAALRHLLLQNPGVFPVIAKDWPTKPSTFEGAKAVLFLANGGATNALVTQHAAEVQKLVDAGVGVVALHQMADYPKDFGDRARLWIGGAFEPGFSKRAHWVDTYNVTSDHPIARGVKSFKIDDGWLFQLRFVDGMKGITPLVRASDPKKPTKKEASGESGTVVSWAYERPTGGRSFVFTGTHLYASFGEEGYRRLLTNGLLWAAGVEVPAQGAKVELSEATMNSLIPPAPPAVKKK